MSMHLSGTGTDQTPVTEADLVDYFREGEKPRSAWRVGAEFEKFLSQQDGSGSDEPDA